MNSKWLNSRVWNLTSTLLVGAASFFGLTYRSANPEAPQGKKDLALGLGVVGAATTAANLYLMVAEKAQETKNPSLKPENLLKGGIVSPSVGETDKKNWTETVEKQPKATLTIS